MYIKNIWVVIPQMWQRRFLGCLKILSLCFSRGKWKNNQFLFTI